MTEKILWIASELLITTLQIGNLPIFLFILSLSLIRAANFGAPIRVRNSKTYIKLLHDNNNMGLVEDLGADARSYSDEAINALEDLEDEIDFRDDIIDLAQDTFDEAATTQMVELYAEEDIPYQTQVELQELTDDMREAAGKPRLFENLPDSRTPSEMYRNEYTRPSVFSTRPLEGFGGLLNGDPKR
jgi:hypothetical protein